MPLRSEPLLASWRPSAPIEWISPGLEGSLTTIWLHGREAAFASAQRLGRPLRIAQRFISAPGVVSIAAGSSGALQPPAQHAIRAVVASSPLHSLWSLSISFATYSNWLQACKPAGEGQLEWDFRSGRQPALCAAVLA